MLQYRVAAEGGVRDVDENKRQVLVTFPWEVRDSYNTDFSRDCFDEFLSRQTPVMCWQHDRKEPIGRVREWQKTSTANEMVAGFSDFEAVPRARQAFAQIRDKEITDFSYGFDAKSIPHPSGERGALRFIKGSMPEISPVTVGAIPGAIAVGLRSVDVAALRAMVDDEQISTEEARQILGLDVPIIGERQDEEPIVPEQQNERERIVVAVAGQQVERSLEIPEGVRSVVLTIADDGTVSASGTSGDDTSQDNSDADDGSSDAGELAGAVDAALDAMASLLDGVDTTDLPPVVQQALALADAAGVAVDQLLEEMGVPDPDEDDGDRAAKAGDDVTVGSKKGTVKKVMPNGALLVDWGDGKSSLVSAADATESDSARSEADDELDIRADGTTPKPPYGDVDYADPGYQKDGQKRYPLNTKSRVKAAWSYINQKDNAALYSAENLAKVKAKIEAAAKKFGITIAADSSARSDETGQVEEGPELEPVDVEMTRATLDLLATR